MSYKQMNQKGFAAVEAVLLVVILAMLGGTGYYIWHANKTASTTYDTASKISESSSSQKASNKATSSAQSFPIKEWKVQAKYSGDQKLHYIFENDSLGYTSALFSSDALDAADPLCKNGAYGGVITRYKSSDKFLAGDGEIDSGMTAAQTAASLQPGQYGHVGDYYYFYTSPQGFCAEAAQDIQTKTMDDVKALLPKLEATPAP